MTMKKVNVSTQAIANVMLGVKEKVCNLPPQ